MHEIDLRRIDLNLLVVFDVLMRERSVTRAAASLARTQSAVSHALARLREQLGDPLLVKVGGRMTPSPRAEQLADLLELRPLLDRATEGFSQGERVKTALARALVHDPDNIILDEPTNGLDVLATRALRETLLHLCSPEGGSKCIVFSTHIMQEVERLCDQVVVVAHGRNVASGSVADLLAQTGQSDFEDAFVHLAFAATPPQVGVVP